MPCENALLFAIFHLSFAIPTKAQGLGCSFMTAQGLDEFLCRHPSSDTSKGPVCLAFNTTVAQDFSPNLYPPFKALQ